MFCKKYIFFGIVFTNAFLFTGMPQALAQSFAEDAGVADMSLWLFVFGLTFFVLSLIALVVLSIIVTRAARRVIEVQESGFFGDPKNNERFIIGKILESEIKTNKSKIEAYLIVYEEKLEALNDTETQPYYRKSGDLIQRQPALERSVFDHNKEKLDVLGEELYSQVVHFYARIKTQPDYFNLESDTSLDDAIGMISCFVNNAKALETVAADLIQSLDEMLKV